jgi:hypothetical protein
MIGDADDGNIALNMDPLMRLGVLKICGNAHSEILPIEDEIHFRIGDGKERTTC